MRGKLRGYLECGSAQPSLLVDIIMLHFREAREEYLEDVLDEEADTADQTESHQIVGGKSRQDAENNTTGKERNIENNVNIHNICAENGHVSGKKKTTATTALGSARRSARRSQSFFIKMFQLLLFRTNQKPAITHKEWKNINEQKCKR